MNASHTMKHCVDSSEAKMPHTSDTGHSLDSDRLREQNGVYAGTGGVSANNRSAGFVPGFLNTRTGVAVASCFADGQPATVHVLDGLPGEWIAERNAQGLATKACTGVVAGFLRLGTFYSREQAAQWMAA